MTATDDERYNPTEARCVDRFALFPTVFWRFRIDSPPTLERAGDDVAELRSSASGRLRSNEGGWQSDRLGLDDPRFGELLIAVAASARVCFDDLGLLEHEPDIFSYWANVNTKGDSNRVHAHGSAVLAAVLYLRVPDETAPLALLDPRLAAMTGPIPTQPNEINRREFSFRPTAGDLVLFPGWILHRVGRSAEAGERISMAFNVGAVPRADAI